VLKWVLDRCEGKGSAKDTVIGAVPTQDAIAVDGLVASERMDTLLQVDPAEWVEAVAAQEDFFTTFGSHLPREMRDEQQRLARAVDTLVVLMGVQSLPRIARELIEHGRPSATPVALVRWGTTNVQETITGTLGDIAALAARARLEPPVVIVIGEVVALRDRLQWFDDNRVPMEVAQ